MSDVKETKISKIVAQIEEAKNEPDVLKIILSYVHKEEQGAVIRSALEQTRDYLVASFAGEAKSNHYYSSNAAAETKTPEAGAQTGDAISTIQGIQRQIIREFILGQEINIDIVSVASAFPNPGRVRDNIIASALSFLIDFSSQTSNDVIEQAKKKVEFGDLSEEQKKIAQEFVADKLAAIFERLPIPNFQNEFRKACRKFKIDDPSKDIAALIAMGAVRLNDGDIRLRYTPKAQEERRKKREAEREAKRRGRGEVPISATPQLQSEGGLEEEFRYLSSTPSPRAFSRAQIVSPVGTIPPPRIGTSASESPVEAASREKKDAEEKVRKEKEAAELVAEAKRKQEEEKKMKDDADAAAKRMEEEEKEKARKAKEAADAEVKRKEEEEKARKEKEAAERKKPKPDQASHEEGKTTAAAEIKRPSTMPQKAPAGSRQQVQLRPIRYFLYIVPRSEQKDGKQEKEEQPHAREHMDEKQQRAQLAREWISTFRFDNAPEQEITPRDFIQGSEEEFAKKIKEALSDASPSHLELLLALEKTMAIFILKKVLHLPITLNILKPLTADGLTKYLEDTLNPQQKERYAEAQRWILADVSTAKDQAQKIRDSFDLIYLDAMNRVDEQNKKRSRGQKIPTYYKGMVESRARNKVTVGDNGEIIISRSLPYVITTSGEYQAKIAEAKGGIPDLPNRSDVQFEIHYSESQSHAKLPPFVMLEVRGPILKTFTDQFEQNSWFEVGGIIAHDAERILPIVQRLRQENEELFQTFLRGSKFPANFLESIAKFYRSLPEKEQAAFRDVLQSVLNKAWDELPFLTRLGKSLFDRPAGWLFLFVLVVAIALAAVFPPLIPAVPTAMWYFGASVVAAMDLLTVGTRMAVTPHPSFSADSMLPSSAKVVPEVASSGTPSPSLSPHTPPPYMGSMTTTVGPSVGPSPARQPSSGSGGRSPSDTVVSQSQQSLQHVAGLEHTPSPEALPPPVPQVVVIAPENPPVEEVSAHMKQRPGALLQPSAQSAIIPAAISPTGSSDGSPSPHEAVSPVKKNHSDGNLAARDASPQAAEDKTNERRLSH